MRTAHTRNLELRSRTPVGRGGTNKAYMLMNPDPDDGTGAFGLRVIQQDASFYSPRHHHAFDQFRYMIEGESDDTPDGKLSAGVLGYFPEGAYYGPESGPPRTLILMQFGSPSGFGLLTREQIAEANQALAAQGSFEQGVYRRNPGVPGKPVQDGFEAAWEYVHKRPMIYPKPQYEKPVFIDTEAFPWLPVADAPGVSEKALGIFSSTQVRAAKHRLDPGARLNAQGRGVHIVLAGIGSVAGEAYETYSALYLDQEETGEFIAETPTELLLLGLPRRELIGAKALPG